MPLALAQLGQLRRHLAPSGRLALTYPVRVGRFSAKASLDHWEARLGEPLKLPRELLAALELEGFEPESVETASDAELADLFRALEPQLDGPSPAREELELHQAAGGKPGTSFALAIVRRKEAGEKPPGLARPRVAVPSQLPGRLGDNPVDDLRSSPGELP